MNEETKNSSGLTQVSFLRMFTSKSVVILIFVGLLFMIAGTTNLLATYVPWLLPKDPAWLLTLLKTLGASIIGSGVFTALIKSREFTSVFSDVVRNIVWDDKFVNMRGDKEALWENLTKSLYTEKFNDISLELQKLIKNHYFPKNKNYYLENFEYIINISEENNDFWKHSEVITFILQPCSDEIIEHSLGSFLDLPIGAIIPDMTAHTLKDVLINGVKIPLPNVAISTKDNVKSWVYKLNFMTQESQNVTIKRESIFAKVTNPEKRIFAQTFTKGMKVTVMSQTNVNFNFYRMGTVYDFENIIDEQNGNARVKGWQYDGIILPNQGAILIVK